MEKLNKQADNKEMQKQQVQQAQNQKLMDKEQNQTEGIDQKWEFYDESKEIEDLSLQNQQRYIEMYDKAIQKDHVQFEKSQINLCAEQDIEIDQLIEQDLQNYQENILPNLDQFLDDYYEKLIKNFEKNPKQKKDEKQYEQIIDQLKNNVTQFIDQEKEQHAIACLKKVFQYEQEFQALNEDEQKQAHQVEKLQRFLESICQNVYNIQLIQKLGQEFQEEKQAENAIMCFNLIQSQIDNKQIIDFDQLHQYLINSDNSSLLQTALEYIYDHLLQLKLPDNIIKDLKTLGNDQINVNKTLAQQILQAQSEIPAIINQNEISPNSCQLQNRNMIVAKEKVQQRIKRTINENILTKNLEVKDVVNQNYQIQKQKQKDAFAIKKEQQEGKDHYQWYYSQRGDYQEFLKYARQGEFLSQEDLDRIKRNFCDQNEIRTMTTIDTLAIQILFNLSQNGQNIPSEYILELEKILKNKVLIHDKIAAGLIQVGKNYVNLLCFGLFNKNVHKYSMDEQLIYIYALNHIPAIFYNMAKNGQILSESTIEALLDAFDKSVINKEDVILTLSILLRNQDGGKFKNKIITALLLHYEEYKNSNPLLFCTILEGLLRVQKIDSKFKHNDEFIKKVCNYLDEIQSDNQNQLFILNQRSYLASKDKSNTIFLTHNEVNLNILFKMIQDNKDLYFSDLAYLSDRLDDDSIGSFNITSGDGLTNSYLAFQCLLGSAKKGQQLLIPNLKRLETLLVTKDSFIRRQILFTLGYSISNGLILQSKDSYYQFNEIFDEIRESACYVIGLQINKNPNTKIDEKYLQLLNNIVKSKNKSSQTGLKNAAQYALNEIMLNGKDCNFPNLEDDIKDVNKSHIISCVYFNKSFSNVNISKEEMICLRRIAVNSGHSIETFLNISAILGNESKKNDFNHEGDRIILNNLKDLNHINSDEFKNGILFYLGNILQSINDKNFLNDSLDLSMEYICNDISSTNASYLFKQFAEFNKFPIEFNEILLCIDIFIDRMYNKDDKTAVESQQNLAKIFAFLAKQKIPFEINQIKKIIEFIKITDSIDIQKILLSFTGFCSLNDKIDFNDDILINIVNCFEINNKDVRDSTLLILEKYLKKQKHQVSNLFLEKLIDSIKNDQQCHHITNLLMYIIKKNKTFSVKACNSLVQILETTQANDLISVITFILSNIQTKLDKKQMQIIEEKFQINSEEILENLTQIYRIQSQHSFISKSVIDTLMNFINDETKSVIIKQNSIIVLVNNLKRSPKFDQSILRTLRQSFMLQEVLIQKIIIYAYGIYFQNDFSKCHSEENKKIIQQLEQNLNNKNFVKNIVLVFDYITYQNCEISLNTINFLNEVLIKIDNAELRRCAKKILTRIKFATSIQIPEHISDTLRIEELSQVMLISDKNLQSNLQELGILSELSDLTLTSFLVFETILEKKQIFQHEILDMMLQYSKKYIVLPKSLLATLIKLIKDSKTESYNIILEIIWNVTVNNPQFPENLINLIQEKILLNNQSQEKIDFKHFITYQILSRASQRQNILDYQALKILLNSLIENDIEYSEKIKAYLIITFVNQYPYIENEQEVKMIQKQIKILANNFQNANNELNEYAKNIITQYSNFLSQKQIQAEEEEEKHSIQNQNQQPQEQFYETEKNLISLLMELKQSNKYNKKLLSTFTNKNKLFYLIQNISKRFNEKSIVLSSNDKNILYWQPKDIQEWSMKLKKQRNNISKLEQLTDEELIEILAVIQRAIILESNKIDQHHELRMTQLIAIIILLRQAENKGRLAQIATGEGKSTTISVIAVVKCLLGYQVDIITSSSELSKRDAFEKQYFYSLFGLSALDNSDYDYKFNGVKRCYEDNVDIIYGDASNYQFDLLRHEYSKLETRGKRSFDNTYAIIDEVDNLLIDDSSKIAMLAETMPGLNNLGIIFSIMWQELTLMTSRFKQIDDNNYEYTKPGGNEVVYVSSQEIKDLTFFTQQMQDFSKDVLECIKEGIFKIPDCIKGFAKNNIEKWVDSAIAAKFVYQKNYQYLIKKDNRGINRVIPIDYQNTGVIQNSTTWGDGLHQFLQLKEHLELSPLTLITNYLSNKAFFEKYQTRLLGVTGTLGSNQSQQLLQELYQVDFVQIPRYKYCQLKIESAQMFNTEKEWVREIISSYSSIIQSQRAMLIICETKKDAELLIENLESEMKSRSYKSNIIPYTRDDCNQSQALSNTIYSGDIIVATNLAGRGTDIKIHQNVEENGGLHVCVSFLPINQRVQEQAFGRAARKGQKGSAQLIINKACLSSQYQKTKDINEVTKVRNQIEKERIDIFVKSELKQIETKDYLFQNFCELLTFLRDQKDVFTDEDLMLQQSQISAVEERWGLWLKDQDQVIQDSKANDTQFKQMLFQKFKDQILLDQEKGLLIKNPSYHIQYGNSLISHLNSTIMSIKQGVWLVGTLGLSYFEHQRYKKEIYLKAKDAYTKAIELDKEFCYIGYYQRSFCQVALGSNDLYDNNQEEQEEQKDSQQDIQDKEYQLYIYKKNAISDLLNADNILRRTIINQLLIQQQALSITNDVKEDCEFYKQIENKLVIMQQVQKCITESTSIIEKSQKLIDVISTKSKTQLYKQSNYETIKFLKAKGENLSDITLRFNSLTAHDDIVTSYQTIETISNALRFDKNLKVDITFQNLSQETAIQLLPLYYKEQQKKIKEKEELQQKQKNEEQKLTQEEIEANECNTYFYHRIWYRTKDVAGAIGDGIKFIGQEAYDLALKDNVDMCNLLYEKYKDWSKDSEKAATLRLNLSFNNLSEQQALEFLQGLSETEDFKLSVDYIFDQNIQTSLVGKNMDALLFIYEKQDQLKQKLFPMQEMKEDSSEEQEQQYANRIDKLEGTSINIKFFMLVQGKARFLIEKTLESKYECSLELNYAELDGPSARALTYNTRDFIGDSILIFNNLTSSQAVNIIKNADNKQQDVKINDVKTIESLFLEYNLPFSEINEAKIEGLNIIISIYEQNPIPWKSCLVVGVLAVVQITLGIILIAIPNVGTGLIAEGVGDLFQCIKGLITRNFSWKEYLIQKAISIAISLATAGIKSLISAYKAARAAQQAGRGVAQIAAQQIEENAVGLIFQQQNQQIGQQVIKKQFANEMVKVKAQLGGQFLAAKFVENGAIQLINAGIDYAAQGAMNQARSQITSDVSAKLSILFRKKIINDLIAIDKYTNSRQFQNKINQDAQKILTFKNQNYFFNIAQGIAEGVLGKTAKNIIKGVELAGGLLIQIQKAAQITQEFKQQYETILNQIQLPEEKVLVLKYVKQEQMDQSQKEYEQFIIAIALKKDQIKNQMIKQKEEVRNESYQWKINYNKLKQLQGKSFSADINIMHQGISDKLANFILQLLYKGIAPILHYGVNKGVGKLADYIQKKIDRKVRVNNQKKRLQEEKKNLEDAQQRGENQLLIQELQRRVIQQQEKLTELLECNKNIANLEKDIQLKKEMNDNEGLHQLYDKLAEYKNMQGRAIMEKIHVFQQQQQLLGKNKHFINDLSDEEKEKYKHIKDNVLEGAREGKGNLIHLLTFIYEMEKKGISLRIEIYKDGKYYTSVGEGNKCIRMNHLEKNDHWENIDVQGNRQRGENDCFFHALAVNFQDANEQQIRLIIENGVQRSPQIVNLFPAFQACNLNKDLFGGVMEGGVYEADYNQNANQILLNDHIQGDSGLLGHVHQHNSNGRIFKWRAGVDTVLIENQFSPNPLDLTTQKSLILKMMQHADIQAKLKQVDDGIYDAHISLPIPAQNGNPARRGWKLRMIFDTQVVGAPIYALKKEHGIPSSIQEVRKVKTIMDFREVKDPLNPLNVQHPVFVTCYPVQVDPILGNGPIQQFQHEAQNRVDQLNIGYNLNHVGPRYEIRHTEVLLQDPNLPNVPFITINF